MQSKEHPLPQTSTQRKYPSQQSKLSVLTPKKENQIKLEPNYLEPTLQKNVIPKLENLKIEKIYNPKNKKKVKRPWNHQQDDLLRHLVQTKGAKQWAHISSFFNQRCGKQCRQRWHNHLRNGIRKGQWTSEQEWTLFLGVHAYGKKWSIISKMLQGRTENTLKNHWNCKMNPKKPYFERRLDGLLRFQSFESIKEKNLFQIIKGKRKYLKISEDQIIELLNNAIEQFFEVKKCIQETYGEKLTNHYSGSKQELKAFDLYQFESFGKKRNFQGTTCEKKSKFTTEIKGQKCKQEFFEEQMIKPFEQDSNQRNAKENSINIESSQNSSQMQPQIYYGKLDNHNENCSSNQQQDNINEKSEFSERYEIEDFCSPMKDNIFESIDLGSSNQKKKLFD